MQNATEITISCFESSSRFGSNIFTPTNVAQLENETKSS